MAPIPKIIKQDYDLPIEEAQLPELTEKDKKRFVDELKLPPELIRHAKERAAMVAHTKLTRHFLKGEGLNPDALDKKDRDNVIRFSADGVLLRLTLLNMADAYKEAREDDPNSKPEALAALVIQDDMIKLYKTHADRLVSLNPEDRKAIYNETRIKLQDKLKSMGGLDEGRQAIIDKEFKVEEPKKEQEKGNSLAIPAKLSELVQSFSSGDTGLLTPSTGNGVVNNRVLTV